MKIVAISDLHLRPTPPINRKDDYVEAQFRKLDFVIDYANQIEAMVVIPGDLFDRAANHPSWFINRVLTSLLKTIYGVEIIPGNHDLIGHSLETFDQNTRATLSYISDYIYIHRDVYRSDLYRLTFVPFGKEVTKPKEGITNILVIHEPVFEDTVPFYMPDAVTVEQLEKKYPGYDLYIAGDIHIPCQKSKTLVSGSMMRMTSAQKDHKPRFYVIDTDTLEVETVFIPIEEDVWADITEITEDEGFKAELKDLAAAMSKRDEGLDYAAVCRTVGEKHWPTFDRLINEYKTKTEK